MRDAIALRDDQGFEVHGVSFVVEVLIRASAAFFVRGVSSVTA